jgi:putative transposase
MNTYKRHRFPPDIISYAVWFYYRFNPSHRDIEDLLAERGITVRGLPSGLETPDQPDEVDVVDADYILQALGVHAWRRPRRVVWWIIGRSFLSQFMIGHRT